MASRASARRKLPASARMFSVSFREQFLLLAILAAMITGAAVKHWRDASREKPVAVPVAAAPLPPR